MPRDEFGVYTLPAGNPVVTETTVASDWANTTFADIATALTDSLSANLSVTPEKFSDDLEGFRDKIGLTAFINEYTARVDALLAKAENEIGDMAIFAMDDIPDNYLECDGAVVSRATYDELFAKIGTMFGVGDGSTTFGLPDMRAAWVRGWDNGRGVDPDRVLGSMQDGQVAEHTHLASSAIAGAHGHTATTSEDGIHTHGSPVTTNGAHQHTLADTTGTNSVGHTHAWSSTSSEDGAHLHNLRLDGGEVSSIIAPTKNYLSALSTTTGSGLVTMQPNASAHSHSVSGTTGGQNASHTHPVSGTVDADGVHDHTATIGSSGAHTHTFTTSEDPEHTHVLTVDEEGGEARMRNVAMVYCIKYRGY